MFHYFGKKNANLIKLQKNYKKFQFCDEKNMKFLERKGVTYFGVTYT